MRSRTRNSQLVVPMTPGPPTARAHGALPPAHRWLVDDPYASARMAIGMAWIDRHMLEGRRQKAVDELDALDREACAWMRRKQAADREALEIHERLWPPMPAGWARRPPRPDQAPLPPVAESARPLGGAVLRRVVLSLLQLHGELRVTRCPHPADPLRLRDRQPDAGEVLGRRAPLRAARGSSRPAAAGRLRAGAAGGLPASGPDPRPRARGLVPGARASPRCRAGGRRRAPARRAPRCRCGRRRCRHRRRPSHRGGSGRRPLR